MTSNSLAPQTPAQPEQAAPAEAIGAEPGVEAGTDAVVQDPDAVVQDLLVEEISIDGMCGVY